MLRISPEQDTASHQSATANLGVGSGIATPLHPQFFQSHRAQHICTGAPTGGLGFKAYFKAFQYEPSLRLSAYTKADRLSAHSH